MVAAGRASYIDSYQQVLPSTRPVPIPDSSDFSLWFNLSVAMGIGLLVGAERERRKGTDKHRGAAGIRTFALSALVGGVASALEQPYVLVVVLLVVGALSLASYQRSNAFEPGFTSEVALLMTCLLGALCTTRPAMAAGIGVALVALLAGRDQMHRFVRMALTEAEFKLLEALSREPGQTVSREALSTAMQPGAYRPQDRTVDSQIYRLRGKLHAADPGCGWIATVRGQGYALRAGHPAGSI